MTKLLSIFFVCSLFALTSIYVGVQEENDENEINVPKKVRDFAELTKELSKFEPTEEEKAEIKTMETSKGTVEESLKDIQKELDDIEEKLERKIKPINANKLEERQEELKDFQSVFLDRHIELVNKIEDHNCHVYAANNQCPVEGDLDNTEALDDNLGHGENDRKKINYCHQKDCESLRKNYQTIKVELNELIADLNNTYNESAAAAATYNQTIPTTDNIPVDKIENSYPLLIPDATYPIPSNLPDFIPAVNNDTNSQTGDTTVVDVVPNPASKELQAKWVTSCDEIETVPEFQPMTSYLRTSCHSLNQDFDKYSCTKREYPFTPITPNPLDQKYTIKTCTAYVKCQIDGTWIIRPATCRASHCQDWSNENAKKCVEDRARAFTGSTKSLYNEESNQIILIKDDNQSGATNQ